MKKQTAAPITQTKVAHGRTGILQRKCACGTHTTAGGACEACRQKAAAALQRSAVNHEPMDEAPPIVHDVLRSPGQPLDESTRAFFEPRFGHDFSHVRVHTDARAAESAKAVNALAYTVGRDVVFGTGQYRSGTSAGNRMLAHELTHVIQQAGGISSGSAGITIGRADDRYEAEAEHAASGVADSFMPTPVSLSGIAPTLQRDPDNKTPIEVAIVLDDDDASMIEGRSYAQTVLRVTSAEDAKKQLAALGRPIGKIYVVSHSTSAGEVKIVSDIGTIQWTKISEFGRDMKDSLSSDVTVDFRGCKLGDAPDELESFRKSTGAGTARGYNCWTFVQNITPLVIDGVEARTADQVPADRVGQFDKALKQQINKLKSPNGHSVKNCLVGLGKGETADKNFDKIKQLYFQKNGELVAEWASKDFNENWQKSSMCTKDLTTSTKPCRIVQAAASSETK